MIEKIFKLQKNSKTERLFIIPFCPSFLTIEKYAATHKSIIFFIIISLFGPQW